MHLAAAAQGAIWTSCGVELGDTALLSRLSQVAPKLICFSCAYTYKGRSFSILKKIKALANSLPTTHQWLCVDETWEEKDQDGATWHRLDRTIPPHASFMFPALPFNHPLIIAFSSGTTGRPKCMVHGAGNVLLQQMKEHQLHLNMAPNDRLLYVTQCGWMMWNWQLAAMASGVTICLHDGHPFYPTPTHILRLADEIGVTHLGVSAGYLQSLEQSDASLPPGCLNTTQAILSTGAPLYEHSYTFVHKHWPHLRLESITGGTDILSCFALGNPLLPVHAGHITSIGLGMDVRVSNAHATSLLNQEGELTCHAVCPSMPTHFLNDTTHEIYLASYFKTKDTIWWHGDCAKMNEQGNLKMLGRLDAVLNPKGVRIGTAELYDVISTLPCIDVCAAVMVKQQQSDWMVLFVKTKGAQPLSQTHKHEIVALIRTQCSPRHVPDAIIQAPDLPFTYSGKLMETLIRDCCNGRPIQHVDAMTNPESLNFFQQICDFQRHRT